MAAMLGNDQRGNQRVRIFGNENKKSGFVQTPSI